MLQAQATKGWAPARNVQWIKKNDRIVDKRFRDIKGRCDRWWYPDSQNERGIQTNTTRKV